MIAAAELVDEVLRLRGSIVLLLYVDRAPEIDLRVRGDARWLIEEIRKRKSGVVTELKRRYLGSRGAGGTALKQRRNGK